MNWGGGQPHPTPDNSNPGFSAFSQLMLFRRLTSLSAILQRGIYLLTYILTNLYLLLMGSTAGPTRTCMSSLFLSKVDDMASVTMLQQRVPTITDSDTEECFPGGFCQNLERKLSQIMSSRFQVVCFWSMENN